jgi:hypothetical protein
MRVFHIHPANWADNCQKMPWPENQLHYRIGLVTQQPVAKQDRIIRNPSGSSFTGV